MNGNLTVQTRLQLGRSANAQTFAGKSSDGKEIEEKKRQIQLKSNELIQLDRTKEAERLESLNTLASGVAHDLNNLLTVIASQNELIELRAGSQVGDLTKEMRKAIELAADLCRELSSISESAPLTLCQKSLIELLREQQFLLSNSIPSGIKIKFSYCDDIDYIDCDPPQLKRVFLNLATNAGEAAESRVEVITSVAKLTSLQLESAKVIGPAPPLPGDFVIMEIIDDGPGIPNELQNRLFDTFFSTKELGRGLGLAIVLKTVSRHGGFILLDSDSTGTHFKVYFPIKNAVVEKTSRSNTPAPELSLRILLVDDDSSVLAATKGILELIGHTVITGFSGEEGLRLFQQTPGIQFVIADLSMPGMSGTEMAEVVMRSAPDLPILLVSGFSSNSIKPSILDKRNVSFLSKPFDLVQLKRQYFR